MEPLDVIRCITSSSAKDWETVAPAHKEQAFSWKGSFTVSVSPHKECLGSGKSHVIGKGLQLWFFTGTEAWRDRRQHVLILSFGARK